MKNISHRISIPAVLEVSKGSLCKIGKLINKSKLSNIVLFFGDGIKNLFGNTIINCIQDNGIKILSIHEYDDIEIHKIVSLAFSIPPETEAIVGVGGGKVIDVSKYICFLTKLPFFSVPTSTSNDGFSSSGSSLIIDGKRTSVSAKMPYGIIVDIDVIKNAPKKYIFSGIGDVVSKITALYDWYFEQTSKNVDVNDFAAMISKKAALSFMNSKFNSIQEETFLEELVNSLTLSGI
jgi:glycerol-1-phosphate dehydrogenase [NAD(P)+]